MTRTIHAIAYFELMLVTTAPAIYHSDHCIQYVIVQPVVWIPAHQFRLPRTNVLLQILCHPIRALCLSEWFDAMCGRSILLNSCSYIHQLASEASILQLKEEGGVQKLVIGSLSAHYEGKLNGHSLLDKQDHDFRQSNGIKKMYILVSFK